APAPAATSRPTSLPPSPSATSRSMGDLWVVYCSSVSDSLFRSLDIPCHSLGCCHDWPERPPRVGPTDIHPSVAVYEPIEGFGRSAAGDLATHGIDLDDAALEPGLELPLTTTEQLAGLIIAGARPGGEATNHPAGTMFDRGPEERALGDL